MTENPSHFLIQAMNEGSRHIAFRTTPEDDILRELARFLKKSDHRYESLIVGFSLEQIQELKEYLRAFVGGPINRISLQSTAIQIGPYDRALKRMRYDPKPYTLLILLEEIPESVRETLVEALPNAVLIDLDPPGGRLSRATDRFIYRESGGGLTSLHTAQPQNSHYVH